MAEFFDQICEILAKNGEKYPGQLTADEKLSAFFKPVENKMPEAAPCQTVSAVTPVKQIITPDAPAAASLEELAHSFQDCQLCPLAKHRHHIVFGEGHPRADLMFVGEGPGYDEDVQGRPFVGKAGQLLDKMIAAMQFSRQEVYIANIVKCRPDGNRNPMPDEIAKCIPFLHRQIQIIKPQVIVCLGAVAAKALLNTENGISKLRGKWCSYQNIPVMPTFHPAFLLRQESAKKEAWQDLQLVMARFGKKPPRPASR